MLLLLSYAVAIPLVLFFGKHVINFARLIIALRFFLAVFMFLPLPQGIMQASYLLLLLCDCLMIVLEMGISASLFSKETMIKAICVLTVVRISIVAALYTGMLPMSFTIFKLYIVAITIGLAYFYWNIPNAWPKYLHKADGLVPPRKMFAAIYFLIAFGACAMVFGQDIAASLGDYLIIFISGMLASTLCLYLLWKCAGVSPFKFSGILIIFGVLGFMLAILSRYMSALAMPACFLIGMSMITLKLNSYYAMFLIERYPSRFILPILWLVAVIVRWSYILLFSFFADGTQPLHGIYLLITIMVAMLYLLIAPYMAHSFNKKPENAFMPASLPNDKAALPTEHAFAKLSGQELRLAELIMQGYTHPEIMKILNITDNTVRGYRKTLYSKLQIHSKRELFELAEKNQV
jgi:DNA-binding CsgD family transcriptional regulator